MTHATAQVLCLNGAAPGTAGAAGGGMAREATGEQFGSGQ